jgi:transcriptional regulator with XRE-family HTH domain
MAYRYVNKPPSLTDPAPHPIEFGRRLVQAREHKKMNQSELARLVGISRSTISFYEAGKRSPTNDTLTALANALNVEKDWLVPSYVRPDAEVNHPKLEAEDNGNGNAWLRINQRVPWPTAVKVLELLRGGR